ncbi:hypothetical protein DSL72_001767 [Monilinia vaccinii-corymbosi]|uniref:Uncharacterized protein n=1 Tax=Monilinia vaccinii-corymbosi TaxID=61207 RepID=A0A8A3PAS0_9HELO|nr:hypothetical protein DSL72_001767 [Monilinia vaccinii-corymbosi]
MAMGAHVLYQRDDAEATIRSVLQIALAGLGPRHGFTLVTIEFFGRIIMLKHQRTNLAYILSARGLYEESMNLIEEDGESSEEDNGDKTGSERPGIEDCDVSEEEEEDDDEARFKDRGLSLDDMLNTERDTPRGISFEQLGLEGDFLEFFGAAGGKEWILNNLCLRVWMTLEYLIDRLVVM